MMENYMSMIASCNGWRIKDTHATLHVRLLWRPGSCGCCSGSERSGGSGDLTRAPPGNLITLQWLRLKGCPWDESTCNMAAREGHQRVLEWARENGCPWRETTSNAAAATSGHLGVLSWLQDRLPNGGLRQSSALGDTRKELGSPCGSVAVERQLI